MREGRGQGREMKAEKKVRDDEVAKLQELLRYQGQQTDGGEQEEPNMEWEERQQQEFSSQGTEESVLISEVS